MKIRRAKSNKIMKQTNRKMLKKMQKDTNRNNKMNKDTNMKPNK